MRKKLEKSSQEHARQDRGVHWGRMHAVLKIFAASFALLALLACQAEVGPLGGGYEGDTGGGERGASSEEENGSGVAGGGDESPVPGTPEPVDDDPQEVQSYKWLAYERQVFGKLAYVWGLSVHDVNADGHADLVFGSVEYGTANGVLSIEDTCGGRNVLWALSSDEGLNDLRSRLEEIVDPVDLMLDLENFNLIYPISSLYVASGDGRGNFSLEHVTLNEPGWLEKNWVGDLDDNGRIDIVVVDNFYGRILRFEQEGEGWSRSVLATSLARAYDVDVADIDGDGKNDIAASGYKGGEFVWFQQPANAGDVWVRRDIDGGFAFTWMVRLADLDGDGLPELVGTAWYDEAIYVWKRLADGESNETWQRILIGKLAHPAHGQVLDMDGDGDKDILVASGLLATTAVGTSFMLESGRGIFWFENPGSLAKYWFVHTVVNDAYDWIEAKAADINGDGIPEVVGTSWRNPGSVNVFEWSKIGVWLRSVLRDPWDFANELVIADFDGDSRDDIVVANDIGAYELRGWFSDATTFQALQLQRLAGESEVFVEASSMQLTEEVDGMDYFEAFDPLLPDDVARSVLQIRNDGMALRGLQFERDPDVEYAAEIPLRLEIYEKDGLERTLIFKRDALAADDNGILRISFWSEAPELELLLFPAGVSPSDGLRSIRLRNLQFFISE